MLLAAAVVAVVAAVASDPLVIPKVERPKHFLTPIHVATEGGSKLDLPPGYYMTEAHWSRVDLEFKDLQNNVTRLTAENASLLKALDASPWSALAVAGIGFAVGVAGGIGLVLVLR